jgi:hypothetical protein
MDVNRLRLVLSIYEIDHGRLALEAGLSRTHLSRLLSGQVTAVRRETRCRLAVGLHKLITAENVV